MELIKVNKLEDIKIFTGQIDEAYNQVDYHLDFVNYLFEDIDTIVNSFIYIKEKATYSFRIIVDTENRNFTELEFAFFLKLEAKLKEHEMALLFNGGYKSDYTLEELMQADTKLDTVINEINKPKFSPFEKYLMIYNYLANKEFKKEDSIEEDINKPRDIIAIMNSDYIVCEGYARLMKYLCDNVGITCICQSLALHQGKEKHMNNLVYLDDDKYDIHGLYYSDVTWDNIGHHAENHTFAFCLLPLDDIKHLRCDFDIDPFFMMFYNPKMATIRALDSDGLIFVGEQVSPDYYIKSFAEDLFPISDKVKRSYDIALEIYLEKRWDALYDVRELFLKNSVPTDAYERQLYVPFGCTLPFLVASLCYNENATSLVENSIKRLLKHIENPLDGPGGPFEGEQLPFYRTSNLYVALDALGKMKKEDINLSLDELKNRSYESLKQEYDSSVDFDIWSSFKQAYDNLIAVIGRLRNILLYNTVKDLISEKYPHGSPIRLISFFRGLSEILAAEGYDEEESLAIIKTYFADSTILAKKAFGDGAINCFKTNTDRY